MVSSGDLYAKIDRPRDVVRFRAPQSPEAILSDWVSDVDKLLHLVETTTHLIHKENMTTNAASVAAASS
jgi:26S proteasome regulatory subunit N5